MKPLRALAATALICAPLAACSTTTKSGGPAPTIPQFKNQRLTAAETTLEKDGLTDTTSDASPLGRDVWTKENWTVVGSSPAAGEKYKHGQQVTLYVLKNDEATWFRVHATMPKITSSDQLAPVSELVKYAYAPGTAPSDASDLDSTFKGSPPPANEAADARGLKESYEYETIVGTRPKTGSKLRVGRYIYVLTKPDAPAPDPSPTSDAPDSSSSGDGDINVPNPDLPNHLPHIHHHHHW